jgi:[protein-PII] uridylyltransferase
MIAGRREDRLVFDLQTQLAGSRARRHARRRASEQLMQRYYRTAKSVTQLNTILLQNLSRRSASRARAPPEPIDERFRAQRAARGASTRALRARSARDPRAFLTLQQHPELKGMRPRRCARSGARARASTPRSAATR